MSRPFKDPVVTKLILQKFNMYLHYGRKVKERSNIDWLRSTDHSEIKQIAKQDPAYYPLVATTSRN